MTLKHITYLLMIFLSQIAFAQNEFQKSYGGLKKESLAHTTSALDNGYISIGTTESFGAGKKDILVIKSDSIGNVVWSKTYGGKDVDFGTYIEKTADGNYYILGHSASFGNQYTDVVLFKIDVNGSVIWARNYALNNSEFANSMTLSPDGGCLLLGETIKYLGKGKDADVLAIKVNNDGGLAWAKKYGGKELDYGYSVQTTKDNGYIIGGETKSFSAGEQDMYLLKLSAEGKLEWAKAYGGAGADYGKAACQTSDEGYLIAGSTNNSKSRDIDLSISKVTKNGVLLWTKLYGGNNQEYLSAMRVLKNDEIIACGYTNSFELPNENAFIQMFTSSGIPKWGKAYGSDSTDVGAGMSIVDDKEVLLCGSTKGFELKSEDAYFIKTYAKRTLEDCNVTDVTTLVTKNIKITETSGGEENEVNMRAIEVKPNVLDCVLETKTLCLPEEDF